jgi:multicomponent Na+:H+ antiporter subunit B
MNPRWRIGMFVVGAIGVAVLYLLAAGRSIGPAPLRNRYADEINLRTVPERHATDAVTAVNFDYRGFDTMGEEFILFVSVMGSLVLLREVQEGAQKPEDIADAISPPRAAGPSDALRVWTLGMVGPQVLFGIYIVTHGQLSPGGGFQGGVILATAPLVIYLAESLVVFQKITPHRWVEVAEAIGAGAYVLIGMLAWIWGKAFLTNVVPLGKLGEPTSGGTLPLISLATGLEVAAGFVLLLYAFLQKVLAPQEGK